MAKPRRVEASLRISIPPSTLLQRLRTPTTRSLMTGLTIPSASHSATIITLTCAHRIHRHCPSHNRTFMPKRWADKRKGLRSAIHLPSVPLATLTVSINLEQYPVAPQWWLQSPLWSRPQYPILTLSVVPGTVAVVQPDQLYCTVDL
jgi:hypothetical protein